MIQIRKSARRGSADHGWLKTYHTFSFADYYDPQNMGFGSLRVINEDFIDASTGFPTHGHRNMEIITYLISGAIEHRDSLNHSQVIHAGEVQVMTAGSGIYHSEHNPLQTEKTHLLQIWIQPNKLNLQPTYNQKSFLNNLNQNQLVLIASVNGRNDSLIIHQNLDVYAARTKAKQKISISLKEYPQKRAWLQLIQGHLNISLQTDQLNSESESDSIIKLSPGDGIAIENETEFMIESNDNAEFILFIE